MKTKMLSLKINGMDHNLDAPRDMPLLWAIRDLAGLSGTKYGCGLGLCGACTVHVDGVAVRSCQTTVEQVVGKSVTTIEGLEQNGNHPVQQAWRDKDVPQCGFCQAGQIMQAASFLSQTAHPSKDKIREAMSGNICRCGCYQRIVDAVHQASQYVNAADALLPPKEEA